jgi:transcriptional regulator with XRE-family HTH domain
LGRGLRREEVAAQASISRDYYSRIEQGRLTPSEPVLETLCHILRLNPDQRNYVENLARQAGRRTSPRSHTRPVRPQLQRLLNQLTETPAFIMGRYLDILAWNPLAGALLGDLDQMSPRDRNYVRMVFTNPRVQAPYENWEHPAREGVAVLRMQAAENPHDPQLAALVGELSLTSPQFRQWWAERNVAQPDFGTKIIRHPQLGDLTFDWDRFDHSGDPDQHLMLWSAEPGTSTHDQLRILGSLLAPATPRDVSTPER